MKNLKMMNNTGRNGGNALNQNRQQQAPWGSRT